VEIESRNWAIVADESRARFLFSHGKGGKLMESYTLDNEAGRAKVGDLLSDTAGRSFDSYGEGRHAMGKSHDPKETAAIRFADTVIEKLVREFRDGHVVRYTLVAAPRFLGHLRKSLEKHHIDPPEATISKDLVAHDLEHIEKALDREN
jgi:protein required for attachment to host cells